MLLSAGLPVLIHYDEDFLRLGHAASDELSDLRQDLWIDGELNFDLVGEKEGLRGGLDLGLLFRDKVDGELVPEFDDDLENVFFGEVIEVD